MSDNIIPEVTGRGKGGKARAANMTKEELSAAAQKMAAARKEMAMLPVVAHGSPDTPLRISDVELPCYVLSDNTRVFSTTGLATGLGWSQKGVGSRLALFSEGNRLYPFINKDILQVLENPIKFKSSNGNAAYGYPATLLVDLCDAILAARSAGALQKQQAHIAERAEKLVRGFAKVGIIALVDEATGYQKDRKRDALAKFLEEYIAKELRPWVDTYPADFFEELCRLRNVPFNSSMRHPQYFGHLVNNITYDRMAPGLRQALKEERQRKHKPKAQMHRFLSEQTGYSMLQKRLLGIITLMKACDTYDDFIVLLDRVHPVMEDIDLVSEE